MKMTTTPLETRQAIAAAVRRGLGPLLPLPQRHDAAIERLQREVAQQRQLAAQWEVRHADVLAAYGALLDRVEAALAKGAA